MHSIEQKQSGELRTAVEAYLSALQAIGNCVEQACPQIGGVYRHRLGRLRARLAFDSSAAVLEESSASLETELNEYAAKTSQYVSQHGVELRTAIAALAQMVHELKAVKGLKHEARLLIARMQDELDAAQRRLRESEVTDPETGLMNRREMERQIQARAAGGQPFVLLQFELGFDRAEDIHELAQQAAARLESQFRHKDMVSRWSEKEFMVLFQGPADIAQSRAEQIVPWVAGRYLLDNGDTVQVSVDFRLLQSNLAA